MDPFFSPDGSRIVCSSGCDGEIDVEALGYDHLRLFITKSTGGVQEPLTSGPFDAEPDWSPEGTKILFVRDVANRSEPGAGDLDG